VKSIMIDLDACNGCLTCTLACAAAHSRSGSIVGAMQEKTPARIFIEAVNGRAVPVTCRHCEEPACAEACMTGAMRKDSLTGLVSNEGHEQKCVGCWMCIMACPYGAVTAHPRERVALKCDGCPGLPQPACVAACPNRALRYEEPAFFAAGRSRDAACSAAQAS
jgi:carbon-monoxide dehydrogenase iron sulfur subunit